MSAIKLSTPSSGSISLSPANTASNLTITVPAVTGTMATTTTPSFTTTIGVGGATPAASGAGITFPATQSASSDANTLDDYEEGTWTPSLGGTATYSICAGNYVKIGRLVYAVAIINVSSIGTGSQNNIRGLPFTNGATNECNCSIGYFTGSATSIGSIYGYVEASSTTIQLTNISAGGGTGVNVSTAIFTNSTQLRIQAVYYANA
jgi:hypothetical protein